MSRKDTIEQQIRQALSPLHLQVDDESHMHNVPEGAESHFKLIVVSERFEGERLVARHRLLNGLMDAQFAAGLHALSINAWTPREWFDRGGKVAESPPCLGGSKSSD